MWTFGCESNATSVTLGWYSAYVSSGFQPVINDICILLKYVPLDNPSGLVVPASEDLWCRASTWGTWSMVLGGCWWKGVFTGACIGSFGGRVMVVSCYQPHWYSRHHVCNMVVGTRIKDVAASRIIVVGWANLWDVDKLVTKSLDNEEAYTHQG